MFAKERKVGPKGQVVIPKDFREEVGISPGSKVIFEYMEDGIMIKKEDRETEKVFEKVAKSGKKVTRKIDAHEAYGSELEDRN